MNKNLLNTGVQEYIRNFSSSDILSVSFKSQLFEGVSNKELVTQLEGRQKCRRKLPKWYDTPDILYPKREAIEQSSSQPTAAYKSEVLTGKTLLDLTGGYGVDSYFFSRTFESVTYCERQEELANIAAHNFSELDAHNVEVCNVDGIAMLRESERNYDVIYLDPARRTTTGKRVFLLGEADPPLPESLSVFWLHTNLVLIKTSPLLDLVSGIKDLPFVKEIHIVGLENEVKEILWLLEKGFSEAPSITSVNLGTADNQMFTFLLSEEKKAIITYGEVGNYIYEPNASLMKAGVFGLLSERLEIAKLHPNSHLYSSDSLLNFPGRTYRVIKSIPYNAREVKRLGLKKAHVVARNFPKSVDSLRTKYKLKDGGDKSLIFTTNKDGKLIAILAERIDSKQTS